MNDKKIELDPFTKSVLDGINRAIKKLVIEKAAMDENLIVADENKNPISVPAKELLKSM
jgi:hypothetical protein